MSEEVTGEQRAIELVRAVLEARVSHALMKEMIAQMRQEWEAEHAGLLQRLKDGTRVLATRETQLREYGLSLYAKTGNKAPCVGVSIRSMTRLQYDFAEALKWAKHHDVALSLDKGTFEKIAKVTPPEFVEIIIEPQATIATDLVAALEGTYHD